jgi:Mn-dependent DtxR family transcriptional regulator
MDRKPATITKMVKRLENNGFVTSFTQNSIW